MTPHWAELAGLTFVALGFASALVILVDEFLLGHRQQMAIMNVVHPVTALYLGPLWLAAYFTRGRLTSRKETHEEAEQLAATPVDTGVLRHQAHDTHPSAVGSWHAANADSHCGAGCTLGDIAGEWIVWGLGPWTIAGATLWPEIALDLPIAWALGIGFSISPSSRCATMSGG